jgi:Mce-associated membrane protein
VSAPKTPKPRRRIAGEARPGDVVQPPVAPSTPKPKLPKPKLPKREKPAADKPAAVAPPAAPALDLPAAPPRPEPIRVPRTKPAPRLVALIVLAVAAVAFGAVGVWRGVDQWRTNNIAESREVAADAAAAAAETIFTYQYNKLPQHTRESEKVMTPTFAKKFKSVSPALNALAPQRKIQVKAVVRNAATVECGDDCRPDRANVLIFIDQARVADGADKPTVFGNRILVSMLERDGKWLVSNIKAM